MKNPSSKNLRWFQVAPAVVMAGVLLTASQAGAGRSVDPGVERWLAHDAFRTLSASPPALVFDAGLRQTAPVTIRLRSAGVLDVVVGELAGNDIVFVRGARGTPLRIGRVLLADVTAEGIARLEAHPLVERVELDVAVAAGPSLEETVAGIDVPPLWAGAATRAPSTGAGVTIGLIDVGVDVFHPMLFRPNGGYFDWIDRNGDSQFEPGRDAVDLDGDGRADDDEIVGLIDAHAFNGFIGAEPILDTDNGSLDIGWDHLYVDRNGNGVRDFGFSEFTEEMASYGEPLLLVDDVNRNGKLDPGEKLVALGTSKIRALQLGVSEYVRGTNLIRAPGHVLDAAGHGTNAAGVVVGGQRGFSRLVGVAPEADLLIASAEARDSYARAIAWLIEGGADVIFFERTGYIFTHLDGSTNVELMIDEAAASGVTVAAGAGNLGGKNKYALGSLAADAAIETRFAIPQDGRPVDIGLSAHWREPAQALDFALRFPSGQEVSLGSTSRVMTVGTTTVTLTLDTSPRGTVRFDVWLHDEALLPSGEWKLTVADDSTEPGGVDAVHIYVWDSVGGLGRGAEFLDLVSEKHLISYPATADSMVTVGGYAGRDGAGFDYEGSVGAGELREYSSRGLRIDGYASLDIAAPDNPLTATNARTFGPIQLPYGAYEAFSGTSGAVAHVAGAAALAKQVFPDLDGLAMKQRLRDGAIRDAEVAGDGTHSVEELWGAGRLNAFNSIVGGQPEENTPPMVAGELIEALPGEVFDLRLSVSDMESTNDELQIQVDANYDGVWDGRAYRGDEAIQIAVEGEGTIYVKVQVVDPQGAVSAALVPVVLPESAGCTCNAASEPPIALVLAVGLLLWRRRGCGHGPRAVS